jgi:nicotinate-nucleotide adenylyltransferase
MSQTPITPVPVPAGVRGVLLYGGVFDPPHRAHVELAAAARDAAMPGAWLVFVPAARSPFKGTPATPDAHRVAMVRLASAGLARSSVWTDEIERGRPREASYWVETLRRARAALGAGVDLRFLIGADQALEFHRWRGFREVLELARPVVMPREPARDAAALLVLMRGSGAWSEEELCAWGAAVLDVPVVGTNATSIRERLGRDEDVSGELDAAVLGHIRAHGLYRAAGR